MASGLAYAEADSLVTRPFDPVRLGGLDREAYLYSKKLQRDPLSATGTNSLAHAS
jgi:hypothetical protein